MNMDRYTIQVFPHAPAIPLHCRPAIIDLLNSIIARNWQITTPHWTEDHSPFCEGYGLVLVTDKQKTIAFSVYRLLEIDGIPVIYRSGTEVLPEYQGQGLYGFITKNILRSIFADDQSRDRIYYCWRTRNPIVWKINSALCTKIVPDLIGGDSSKELENACHQIAATLYPDAQLEMPHMLMRGVYGHITYHSEPKHSSAMEVNAAIEAVAPNSADAIFSLGEIHRSKSFP
jgi:hypothetical protein